MSSPLSSLKKKKTTPMNLGTRPAPYKPRCQVEDDLLSQVLASNNRCKPNKLPGAVTNTDLMASMMSRLTTVEKQLLDYEEIIREKDKRIRVLEDKCEIYKNAQGYGDDQLIELERKCHKLQKQIHSMENFLEDYGMIWVGTNNSSDDEIDAENELENEENHDSLWKPDLSYSKSYPREFRMDYDLVLKNIKDLNEIAGEGLHHVKYTKDGARLEVQDPVPLTLYENGIFMFGGPFRPFDDATTQLCMQDLMDGYFPSELQEKYPDGVPFKVVDKRDVIFRDKRMEKLFPGQGYSLSPERSKQRKNMMEEVTEDEQEKNKMRSIQSDKIETTNSQVRHLGADNFLCKLPPSVIRDGKIIDIREGVRDLMQDKSVKNDVIVVETDVVKNMKMRLSSGRKSRPQTPSNISTLRIKSETGDHTYVLKMLYSETIQHLRKYLDTFRNPDDCDYDIKTSFPNRTYTDENKSLRDYGLVPNATLHMVVRNVPDK